MKRQILLHNSRAVIPGTIRQVHATVIGRGKSHVMGTQLTGYHQTIQQGSNPAPLSKVAQIYMRFQAACLHGEGQSNLTSLAWDMIRSSGNAETKAKNTQGHSIMQPPKQKEPSDFARVCCPPIYFPVNRGMRSSAAGADLSNWSGPEVRSLWPT